LSYHDLPELVVKGITVPDGSGPRVKEEEIARLKKDFGKITKCPQEASGRVAEAEDPSPCEPGNRKPKDSALSP
jgi:hypothetical protein